MTRNHVFGALIAALMAVVATAPALAEQAASTEVKQLESALSTMMKGRKPDSISETPIPGLFQVTYGVDVFYMTADARYLVDGAVIDLADRHNFTEAAKAQGRKAAMDQLPTEEMLVYPAKDEKYRITVFTDIDCPYCQMMHREVEALNDQGVTVQYLMYPRAGINSGSYRKAVSVWCSEDRNEALTRSKAGEPVTEQLCDNPVRKHMQLGEAVGVSGTPAIVLDNGQLIPGYRPAKELVPVLKQQAERQAAAR
ncbi:MAG TPA: DsbC family protein [Thioalkalivibrio sp.]|nr:DsbC family protein [Thioalkalivibrio sp.]